MLRKLELSQINFFLLINLLFLAINLPFLKSFEEFYKTAYIFLYFPLGLSVFFFFPRILKFVFSILWVLTTIIIFFRFTWNIIIIPEIIVSFFYTKDDNQLILEFITLKLVLFVLFFGILPAVFICLLKVVPSFGKIKHKIIFYVLFISFCILIIELSDKRYRRELRFHSFRELLFAKYTPLDLFHNGARAFSVILTKPTVTTLSAEYEYSLNADKDLKIIFILGESARADRLSINGYKRDTTPNLNRLAKEPNFVNFNEIESCGNVTYVSGKCMFSRMTSQTYSDIETETALTEVLQADGFKINIVSAQNMLKFYVYLGFDLLLGQVDILRLKNESKVKDEYLLEYVKKYIEESGNSFTIAHLMGAHFQYSERYPKSFEKWKVDKSKPRIEWENNAYDNSILYSDFVISEIIKMAEKEKVIVFYVSDHGQSLGENGNWYHGSNGKDIKEQFSVPFFVYLSPKFAETKQGKTILKNLKKNVGRGDLSHDNIFHSVLGCAGLENKTEEKPLIDNSLNLCN